MGYCQAANQRPHTGKSNRRAGRAAFFERGARIADSLFPDIDQAWGADISECGKYRYRLWRKWSLDRPVVFIGLNPSTADAFQDDPTIRRCVGFAKDIGGGAMVMLNLFAYRATDPRELKKVIDPVGTENDKYLLENVKGAEMVLAAWGNRGILLDRDKHVKKLLRHVVLRCLGKTTKGNPNHPLYLPKHVGIEYMEYGQ